MTLADYEKVLEEKRKALQPLKSEERKVNAKEFESMQPLFNKKGNDDIFIKLVRLFGSSENFTIVIDLLQRTEICFGNYLWFIVKGSEKDKRKEAAEKDEKAKKVSYLPLH